MSTCQHCLEPMPVSTARNGIPKKWCSPRCRVAARRRVPTPLHRLVCKICGERFEAKRSDTLYCSRPCKMRADYERAKDSGYLAAYRAKNYEAQRERLREYRRRVPAIERRTPAIVDAEKRREERKRREAEKIPRLEIFERDDWTCGICDEAIDRDLSWPDPLSASLDHVTPLAKAGKHTRDNLQAAHLRCNLQKGDRVA